LGDVQVDLVVVPRVASALPLWNYFERKIMKRECEGEACGVCRRDELGLLECQECHEWIVNMRTPTGQRVCPLCAMSVRSPVEREEVDALADRSNYDGTCHECGRDDLGFLCCAVCGTELARRPDEGERLCAVCAVEDTHENLRRILAGADATE
jgi:hypothetical protein